MSLVKDKLLISKSVINDITNILKSNSEHLKTFRLLVDRIVFSNFHLVIDFKGELLMSMHGEDYYGLKMYIDMFDDKYVNIFNYEKTIDKVEDMFEILSFDFDKKSYVISLEEIYNNVSSYKRKKDVLFSRMNSVSTIENMLKFIDFKNKYSIVDIMFVVLSDISILNKYKSLIDTILNKIDYYGCEIELSSVGSSPSGNCVSYMYEKLKDINSTKLTLDPVDISNKYSVVYDNYIQGLESERMIIS